MCCDQPSFDYVAITHRQSSFASFAVHCAVDEMLVKISSLVGGNPEWHTGDPLTISFKKVLPTETVRALWDKVSTHCTALHHKESVVLQ